MKKLAYKDGYTIVEDEKKGYIHVDPIPSKEELEMLYKKEYYENEKKTYIDNTKEDLQWWETLYKDKYDTFQEHAPSKKKKILDIGCGSGYFLAYGMKRGWDCYGVEPSKKAANHAKTLGLKNIITDIFQPSFYEKNFFDVIHLNQVLEHIPNPEKLLEEVATLLKPNGIICVSVPNEFNPLQNALHKEKGIPQWWIAPPHHLNYFTRSSLSQLLIKTNFEPFLEEATFAMELFLLFGDNYIDDPSLGRAMHKKRKEFDIILSKYDNNFKRKLYQSLAQLDIGRTIVIYAKKV